MISYLKRGIFHAYGLVCSVQSLDKSTVIMYNVIIKIKRKELYCLLCRQCKMEVLYSDSSDSECSDGNRFGLYEMFTCIGTEIHCMQICYIL